MALNGGKNYLADWIIGLMPPRCKNPNAPAADDLGWLHYVEPYFGGGAVLLANDPAGISEVVNDLNSQLTNFWAVLRDERDFAELSRALEATEFSEILFAAPHAVPNGLRPTVRMAWEFFIRCRQSLSGRMKGFAGITRNRTRRGMNEQVSAWLNCIEGLPEVHARLKRVLILNQDALTVIRKHDGPRTLFYLDPPYLHSTRASTGEYEHEMSYADHRELLWLLSSSFQGRFLLSGYHSELYDKHASAHGWKCHEFKIDNKAAGGKVKRIMTECVWTNY